MIRIKEITEKPLSAIGGDAAYCYGMEDKVKRFRKIAERCLYENHGRVTEFADLKIEISGYSAKMIRELYTHIQGTSRLQASTRYIDYTKQYDEVIPPSVLGNEEAKRIWQEHSANTLKTMQDLKDIGIPVEDFSNKLPMAYETKMVLKINLRALIHMFGVRSCTCAYHEYRKFMVELKNEILRVNDEEWTFLCDEYFVPKCFRLMYCEEETRNCGIRPTKSEVKKLMEEHFKRSF